ncbi:MAG: hypothetical protein ABSA26_10810 [Thermoguttaceae bacterium]|jgi:hypothetical protein
MPKLPNLSGWPVCSSCRKGPFDGTLLALLDTFQITCKAATNGRGKKMGKVIGFSPTATNGRGFTGKI